LFGHALLEQALTPEQLLVGKALVFQADDSQDMATVRTRCAEWVASGKVLHDPLELRPLPLSGVPGWRDANAEEAFHRGTVCYQPRRAGRHYPPPIIC
jgi:hypothetical protein